jgi:type I restriction-modification system DNA methylase subunit
MTDTNQKQLSNTLWSIADQLRGAMDAEATVKESLTVQIKNSREVLRTVLHPTYS